MVPHAWSGRLAAVAAASRLRLPGRGFAAQGGCREPTPGRAPGPAPAAAGEKPRHLQGVRNIVAVASGKGGVGKSSVSVNLAYVLSSRGHAVGILDADIYGPSLPVLIPLRVKGVCASPAGAMVPLEHRGVRLMSMGYVRPGEHAAIRGPMVSAMVQQLLTQVEWGDLDYLVVDMPPGTGDIHLTVAQSAQVDAAVVVSTPQALSIADVEKGITMFNQVSIPTIAVVENMSAFTCGACGAEHALFDRPGRTEQIGRKFGVPALVRLPLDPALSGGSVGDGVEAEVFACDPAHRGRPLVAGFEELADATVRELRVLKQGRQRRSLAALPAPSAGGPALLELRVDSAAGEERRLVLEARAARLACRSATMWDEFTGEKLFRDEDIPLDVHPKSIRPAGAYAVHIDWSDGHKSLISLDTLQGMACEES